MIFVKHIIQFFLLSCFFYLPIVCAEMDVEFEKTQIRKQSAAWNESFTTRNADKLLPLADVCWIRK